MEYATNGLGASAANVATPNCSVTPRPRPPYLNRFVSRHGKVMWCVRVGSGAERRRVFLKSPFGTPEFESEYRAILADAGVPMHPPIHQGETPRTKAPDFTNCGKVQTQESPVKQGQKKLTRVPFTVSRLMEFCTRRELVNQTGHDVTEWPLVVVKELLDNALDHTEEAGIAPIILIDVQGDKIIVEDNGRGIPAKVISSVLDYSIRVSSREAYCSPTRGQQGNALKTILPMAYVLNEHLGEDASGTTIIESHGVAHRIEFAVDHIKQEPKIARTIGRSSVTSGTRITVTVPAHRSGDYARDLVESAKPYFLVLAESYAWLNPHLTLRVTWNGEPTIKASRIALPCSSDRKAGLIEVVNEKERDVVLSTIQRDAMHSASENDAKCITPATTTRQANDRKGGEEDAMIAIGDIDRLFPNTPKIELFARTARPSWTVWGNEIPREAMAKALGGPTP